MDDFSRIGNFSFDYENYEELVKELEKLLESEEIYEDNDDTNKLWTINELSSLKDSMKIVATDVVGSLLCIVFFILAPLVSTGITQHVYMAKSLILFFSSLPIILTTKMLHISEELRGSEEFESDQLQPPKDTTMTTSSLKPIHHIESLSNFFAKWDELTTLILAYELYQCVVKTERRYYKWLSFVRMQGVSLLIASGTFGLRNLFLLIQNEWWKTLIFSIFPICCLTSLVIFLLVLYCGFHMLRTLPHSDQFHNNNAAAANNRKHWHLVLIIYTILISQFFKFFFQIMIVVITTIAKKNMDDCLDSYEKNQAAFYLARCLPSMAILMWLRRNHYLGILEVFGVLCILIHKKLGSISMVS